MNKKYLYFSLALGATILLMVVLKKRKISADGISITKYLMKLGYSKAQASGITGNIFVESEYNTKAVGDNGTSFGLAQWHNERWDALKKYASNKKLDPYEIESQLDYLDFELKNSEKNAYNKLKQTNTPYDSAFVFAKYFERPATISERRMEKAEEVYKQV